MVQTERNGILFLLNLKIGLAKICFSSQQFIRITLRYAHQPPISLVELYPNSIFLHYYQTISLYLNYKLNPMLIERTNSEVIIRLSSNVDTEGLQRLVDFLSYKEATSKSKAQQSDVDKLSKQVKKGWWSKNRSRLIK